MRQLDSQIENKTLSHAYIFESENVEYNKKFALDFAKKVFESKGIYISNDLNPDLIVVDYNDEIIDIRSVRELIKNMALKANNKKFKIYIIHNAYNMRVEGQNAMLKSIEELKDYNMVIFTTKNRQLLLPTIRSRCQIIRLSNQKTDIDVDIETLSKIISEIYQGNVEYYYQNKNFFANYKNQKQDIFDGFLLVFKEVLKGKYLGHTGESTLEYNIRELKKITIDQLEELTNLIYTIKASIKTNINYDLAIEELIFSIYKKGMIKWT